MNDKLFRDFIEPGGQKYGGVLRFYMFSITIHLVILIVAMSIPLTPSDVSAWIKRYTPKFASEQAASPNVLTRKDNSEETRGYFSATQRDPLEEELAGSAVIVRKPAEREKTSRNNTAPPDSAQGSSQNFTIEAPQEMIEADLPATAMRTHNAAGYSDPLKNIESPTQYTYIPPNSNRDLVDSDEYVVLNQKPFQLTVNTSQSTFSTQVGTLSYPSVRRALKKMELPSVDQIRIEEMINYFYYDYPQPTGPHPISVITTLGSCPWNPRAMLLHIGIKGKTVFGDGLKDSLYIIADDVKVLVSFNPNRVKAHRLIGYGRQTPKVGPWDYIKIRGKNMWAGQRITTLYEFIPVNSPANPSPAPESDYYAVVDITYKKPNSVEQQTIRHKMIAPVSQNSTHPDSYDTDFEFAAAVAYFGLMLENPDVVSPDDIPTLRKMAGEALKNDPHGHRQAFLELVDNFRKLREEKKKKNAKPAR